MNCLKVFIKSFTFWVKSSYRELRRVLGLLQKVSSCAKGGHNQYVFMQYDFFFNSHKSTNTNSKAANTNSKEQALSKNQNRGKL